VQCATSDDGVDARTVQLNPAFRQQLCLALSQRDTSPWYQNTRACLPVLFAPNIETLSLFVERVHCGVV